MIDLNLLDVRSSMGRRLGQPLYKAVGIRKGDSYRPRVIDGTAGYGEDAYLLAAVGCDVLALERCVAVHAMLEKAVQNARPTAGGLVVTCADLLTYACDEADRPDVVYLDPMYPAGRKTAERKAMKMLRELVGDDTDQAGLLAAGLRLARRRVVVKRPKRAGALNGIEPVSSHGERATRYDVYVPGVTRLV